MTATIWIGSSVFYFIQKIYQKCSQNDLWFIPAFFWLRLIISPPWQTAYGRIRRSARRHYALCTMQQKFFSCKTYLTSYWQYHAMQRRELFPHDNTKTYLEELPKNNPPLSPSNTVCSSAEPLHLFRKRELLLRHHPPHYHYYKFIISWYV